VGQYTAKKRKATLTVASADEFLRALLEAGFGGEFNGTLTTKKFKMKAKFQSRNDQDMIDVKLKAKALVSGDLDGEPISGKTRLTFRGVENKAAIRLPIVLRPVRNSGKASTGLSDNAILSQFAVAQKIWDQAGILFDVSIKETALPLGLMEQAERDGIIASEFPLRDVIEDPVQALHLFFMQKPTGNFGGGGPFTSGFAQPSAFYSAVADERFTDNVIAHELGHNLSLTHVDDPQAVMAGGERTRLSSEEITRARNAAAGLLALFSMPSNPPKAVFASNASYTGDLLGEAQALAQCASVSTGVDAGDCICQAEADAAGLSGTYKAWLSDSTSSPDTIFLKSLSPYEVPRLSGIGGGVALSYANLIDSVPLLRPISRTATTERTSLEFVWTGTQHNGRASGGGAAQQNCTGWTSSTGTGTIGQIRREAPESPLGAGSGSSSFWSEKKTLACSKGAGLYCFEQ